MNISKFLIIDAAFVIAGLSLLFLFNGGKKKYPFLQSPNTERQLRNTSIKLPEKEKLLKLEKRAQKQGSEIEFDNLIGNWKFVSVWKKGFDEENAVFSSFLRIFYANIEFKKDKSIKNSHKLTVIASIRFGLLTIEISGSGFLKGTQPLLMFFLNLIELKSNSKTLLSKSLKEPKEREKSYFSLIALGKNGQWLSARGQSGAVVIWLKD
tara:strand:+ start:86 stop:712 length:627 start_codon:yes stop_codon:yes gene_type:complete